MPTPTWAWHPQRVGAPSGRDLHHAEDVDAVFAVVADIPGHAAVGDADRVARVEAEALGGVGQPEAELVPARGDVGGERGGQVDLVAGLNEAGVAGRVGLPGGGLGRGDGEVEHA